MKERLIREGVKNCLFSDFLLNCGLVRVKPLTFFMKVQSRIFMTYFIIQKIIFFHEILDKGNFPRVGLGGP